MYCVKYKSFSWRNMPYGIERRNALIDHILIMNGLPVNRRHCVQTHSDPDIKYLLKKGKIKQTRRASTRFKKIWKFSGSNTTYLVLV